MPEPMTALPRPCASCPYRRDAPSGLWDAAEYAKLPPYDADTASQPTEAFACHQRNGRLCSGWLACHDPRELLAVRLGVLTGSIDPAVFEFSTSAEVFASAAEAVAHGLRDMMAPGRRARDAMRKLRRLRGDDDERPGEGITGGRAVAPAVAADADG